VKKSASCLFATFFAFSIYAGDPPSIEQRVQTLVEKGITSVKTIGLDKTFTEINTPKGNLSDGELYLFSNDFKGATLAHGANQKLIGQVQYDLLDADGKPFMQELIKIASTTKKGWVSYKWTNPLTKKIQEKRTFIMRVEGKDLFIGCGYYK
jgi:cytochrome c